MKVAVRGHRVEISQLLHDYSTQQMRQAFGSLEGHVEGVEVVFADLNGPRGGNAQACRLFVRLRDRRTLIAEAREPDFYGAIRRGAARARQALARWLRAVKDATREKRTFRRAKLAREG